MHIETNRKDLAAILAGVSRVVETRNTYPILANVLLTADGETLTVRGTDLDIEITMSIPATGQGGVTTLPARQLLDIVKRLNGDTVKIDLKGEIATIKAGRSVFRLAALAADNFPSLASGAFNHEFSIDLAATLKPLEFAMSTESTRYYLCGIYMHDVDGKLLVVATDGNRLARLTATLPDGAKGLPGTIVPRKLVSLLTAIDGEARAEVSDTKIRVTAGGVTILSKLIEGTYPDYQRVIPKAGDKVATVDHAEFVAAVNRVAAIASDRGGNAVKLLFAADSLRLEVTNPDHGTSSDEIAAAYSGEPFDIGFNARYLGDMLGSITGAVKLEMTNSGAPVRVTGANDNLLGVLMPMRVS